MNEPEQIPAPPIETIWPPPPLRDAEPLPVFISAEGIEVIQCEGRLVVSREFDRRTHLIQICIGVFPLLLVLSTPWIISSLGQIHYPVRSAILSSLTISFHSVLAIYIAALLLTALLMLLVSIYLSHGTLVVDKNNRTIKTGGRFRPIGSLGSVQVTESPYDVRASRFALCLLWNHKGASRWQNALARLGAKSSVLITFRRKENALKVATAIAEFVGVPIQRQTR